MILVILVASKIVLKTILYYVILNACIKGSWGILNSPIWRLTCHVCVSSRQLQTCEQEICFLQTGNPGASTHLAKRADPCDCESLLDRNKNRDTRASRIRIDADGQRPMIDERRSSVNFERETRVTYRRSRRESRSFAFLPTQRATASSNISRIFQRD